MKNFKKHIFIFLGIFVLIALDLRVTDVIPGEISFSVTQSAEAKMFRDPPVDDYGCSDLNENCNNPHGSCGGAGGPGASTTCDIWCNGGQWLYCDGWTGD